MASLIEQRSVAGSPCDELPKRTERGLGPEFIYPFVALFFATTLRKILRHYHNSLPYTVILMLVGVVLGAFYQYEIIKRFTFIADLTPVEILAIFLPVLIFESAFSCDPHIFIRCLGQILILAILGFLISVGLTTLAVMYWYENEQTGDVQTCWTWDQAVLYSAVVSATDPVSVVSLLKSMTSLKTLSTVIEGESLLNDAAAITIYTLVKNLIYEATELGRMTVHETRATLLGINADRCANAARFLITRKITAIYLLKFVLKTIAAAVLIGYVIAHITIFTLYRIEAGEFETCITITMSYFVYLTCEAVEASGVIGVVLLGLTLNSNRACFSVSAIHISEQTWQLLSYVANSLIFLTVGVILLKTHSGTNQLLLLLSSIPHLLLIYIILILVRAIMILSVHFLLKQIAYGFTWKDSIVTIWSGLRGGVSLVLALTLFNSKIKDKYQAEIMLVHTTAIVFLTCTVNALTIPSIIHILRLDRTSELIKQTMSQVMKELKSEQNEMIRSLKGNPILATANWLFVEKAIEIQSPFDEKNKETMLARHQIDIVKCDHCQTDVTIPISKFEFEQTFEDCRVRILRLQKTHFWSDYYDGQLSSYGLHTLNSLCDRAIDTPEKSLDFKSIKSHIVGNNRGRFFLNKIRTCTRNWQIYLPWYSSNQSENCYSVFFHYLPIPFLIILSECLIIIYQLSTNLCNALSNNNLIKLHLIIEIISFLLLSFDYMQLYHWFYHNKQRKFHLINLVWMIFYAFAITCRLLSCIIYLIIFLIGLSTELCRIFYILKSLSLVECLILCLLLIEPLRLFVDYIFNRYVRASYDIGLAYISSEEQVLRIIHRLTDNETIRIRIHELSLQHIKTILNDVLTMQEEHPGTVISIKTHHTLNLLYNAAKRGLTQIRSRGVLDIDDCDLLEQSIKHMHVHLSIPSTMPPASLSIASHHFAWIFSNEQLTMEQKNQIEQKLLRALPNENTKRFGNELLLHPYTFSWPDFLWHKDEQIQGVYLLVNGMAEEWRLDPYDIDAYHRELRWKENNRVRRATLTTQQLLSPKNKKEVLSLNSNAGFPDTLSEESTTSTATDFLSETQSRNALEKDANTEMKSYDDDHLTSTTRGRIAFEDGFYVRWSHLISNSITDKFNDTSTAVDDDLRQHSSHVQSEENFDEFFNETFDKYRQIHSATSERAYRRYSYGPGDCIGLYDLLRNNNEKHASTAKCLTNVTAFFISKEKLLEILNTYSLWDIVWLDIGIHLALRILPDIPVFQHSLSKSCDNRPLTDFSLVNQRLSNAGLLIYNERTCTTDDVIQLYEDLLLLTGSVRNENSQCIYEAPIFIKRSLSKQGLKLLESRAMTKILVIPRGTTVARNDLFMDNSLIQHILDTETKRESNRKASSHEFSKKALTSRSEHLKSKHTRKLDEKRYINNDVEHPQMTSNIHRFLLASAPERHAGSSSNKPSVKKQQGSIGITVNDQHRTSRSMSKSSTLIGDIHSDESVTSQQTFDAPSSEYQTAWHSSSFFTKDDIDT